MHVKHARYTCTLCTSHDHQQVIISHIRQRPKPLQPRSSQTTSPRCRGLQTSILRTEYTSSCNWAAIPLGGIHCLPIDIPPASLQRRRDNKHTDTPTNNAVGTCPQSYLRVRLQGPRLAGSQPTFLVEKKSEFDQFEAIVSRGGGPVSG